ncbi:CD99 antigen isoform b precursor, partial [Daubentonia madagascariensis]
QRTLLEK